MDVSENRLPETKNNFSDYDISQPTPSVSVSVLLTTANLNRRDYRLATNRLANIFGNGTIYIHDKKLKNVKTPEIKQAPQNEKKSCEGLCESLARLQPFCQSISIFSEAASKIKIRQAQRNRSGWFRHCRTKF